MFPVTIEDARGTSVTVDFTPQSIVSLEPDLVLADLTRHGPFIETLSGGEAQMAMLAGAIAQEPRLGCISSQRD